jgi:transcriptional regulator with XRE-family HTH domain
MSNTDGNRSDLLVRMFASWIVLKPSFLTFMRELTKRSHADVARQAAIDEQDVKQIECGMTSPSISDVMSIARTFVIPSGDEDEDYIFEPANPNRKEGKKKYRDKWYGKRPDEFQDWWHVTIKPHLRPYNPDDYGKKDFDDWENEWRSLGCPRPEQIIFGSSVSKSS